MDRATWLRLLGVKEGERLTRKGALTVAGRAASQAERLRKVAFDLDLIEAALVAWALGEGHVPEGHVPESGTCEGAATLH